MTLLSLDRNEVLASCESTQTLCLELAKSGAPEGAVVWSWEQTRGQGRGDHSWISPANAGLWLSFVLRPAIPLEQWPALTALVAVAAAQAIESMAGDHVSIDDAAVGMDVIGMSPAGADVIATSPGDGQDTEVGGPREPIVETAPVVWIKWPNDLYGRRGKLGGVLAQAVHGGLVMGLGINVWQRASDFPPALRGLASSLSEEGWLRDPPPEDLSRRRGVIAELAFLFNERLGSVYRRFQSGDSQFLRAALLARFYLRGALVEIEDGGKVRPGIAVDIGPDGELILEAGCIRSLIRSGTVRRCVHPSSPA